MKRLLAVLCLVSAWGCSQSSVPEAETWTPTEQMLEKGEQVGRSFALEKLDISGSQLEKMEADFTHHLENGRQVLWIQFYDPEYHQPLPEGVEAIEGGFPSYFTVSIDVNTWGVVDHYAEPE